VAEGSAFDRQHWSRVSQLMSGMTLISTNWCLLTVNVLDWWHDMESVYLVMPAVARHFIRDQQLPYRDVNESLDTRDSNLLWISER